MGRSLRPIKNIIFLHVDVGRLVVAGGVCAELVCSWNLEIIDQSIGYDTVNPQ